MRTGLCLMLVLLILVTQMHVQAQPTADLRLHTPTAEEFVQALPEVLAHNWQRHFRLDARRYNVEKHLFRLLETEFLLRYEADTNVELLTAAFDRLNRGETLPLNQYSPYLNIPRWHQRIVQNWLMAHPTDLRDLDQLEFMGYHITIEQANFDGTGELELVLTIEYADDYDPVFADYWIAYPDATQVSRYSWERSLLSFSSAGHSYSQSAGAGAAKTLLIADINADGKDEWVARGWATLPGSGYIGSRKYLHVQGWRDGEWQWLTAAKTTDADGNFTIKPFFPESVSDQEGGVPPGPPIWTIENVDDDPALEIVQLDYHLDNWDCIRITHEVFDWDGTYFIRGEVEEELEDTVNCALRQAEIATHDHDYDTAIPFYEHAVSLYEGDFVVPAERSNTTAQFTAYAQKQLVIAYVLAGRPDDARALLDSLRTHPLLEGTIAEQLLTIPPDEFDALPVCQTAYQFIDEIYYHTNSYLYRDLQAIGRTWDDIQIEARPYTEPRPIYVGCDLSHHYSELLATVTVSSDLSPIEQLAQLGVDVADYRQADLNGDGLDEWLLWLAAKGRPFLLAQQAGEYHLSHPDIARPNDDIQVTVQPLPDHTQAVVITIYDSPYFYHAQWDVDTVYCPDPEDPIPTLAPGALKIWQWQTGDLINTLSVPLCAPPDVAAIFAGDELRIWGNPMHDGGQKMLVEPVSYLWDADQGTYVEPASENIHVIPGDPPALLDTEFLAQFNALHSAYDETVRVFHQGDYAAALAINAQPLLDAESVLSSDFYLVLVTRHYRALSYEALDRPADALAEYVHIYTAAPESAWGVLAALHLEEVSNQ